MTGNQEVHELRTWPRSFQAVLDGDKRYEFRKNDRNFQIGDVLFLREWEPDHEGACSFDGPFGTPLCDMRCSRCQRAAHEEMSGTYTGRSLRAKVTYLTPSGAFGVPDGHCVLGIRVLGEAMPDYSAPPRDCDVQVCVTLRESSEEAGTLSLWVLARTRDGVIPAGSVHVENQMTRAVHVRFPTHVVEFQRAIYADANNDTFLAEAENLANEAIAGHREGFVEVSGESLHALVNLAKISQRSYALSKKKKSLSDEVGRLVAEEAKRHPEVNLALICPTEPVFLFFGSTASPEMEARVQAFCRLLSDRMGISVHGFYKSVVESAKGLPVSGPLAGWQVLFSRQGDAS